MRNKRNFIKKLASSNGFPWSVVKSIIHQVQKATDKALIMPNHQRYCAFMFVFLTAVIKDVSYSNVACAKFDLIASKLVLLKSRLHILLIKLSFIVTPKIKLLFCIFCLFFTIFLVLVVVLITLSKQKECYMKGQLNMLGLIVTVLFTNISTTAQVSCCCCIYSETGTKRHHMSSC